MKKPYYSDDFYKRLCGKKDSLTKEPLILIQFERIGEFDEKVRTTGIADSNPEIFKSLFKPCNYIIFPYFIQFYSILYLS
jgi:hypothetical protein